MKKFVINGSNSEEVKFDLAIPKAKHFEVQAVFKGEKLLQVQHVINDAVQTRRMGMGSPRMATSSHPSRKKTDHG